MRGKIGRAQDKLRTLHRSRRKAETSLSPASCTAPCPITLTAERLWGFSAASKTMERVLIGPKVWSLELGEFGRGRGTHKEGNRSRWEQIEAGWEIGRQWGYLRFAAVRENSGDGRGSAGVERRNLCLEGLSMSLHSASVQQCLLVQQEGGNSAIGKPSYLILQDLLPQLLVLDLEFLEVLRELESLCA